MFIDYTTDWHCIRCPLFDHKRIHILNYISVPYRLTVASKLQWVDGVTWILALAIICKLEGSITGRTYHGVQYYSKQLNSQLPILHFYDSNVLSPVSLFYFLKCSNLFEFNYFSNDLIFIHKIISHPTGSQPYKN